MDPRIYCGVPACGASSSHPWIWLFQLTAAEQVSEERQPPTNAMFSNSFGVLSLVLKPHRRHAAAALSPEEREEREPGGPPSTRCFGVFGSMLRPWLKVGKGIGVENRWIYVIRGLMKAAELFLAGVTKESSRWFLIS